MADAEKETVKGAWPEEGDAEAVHARVQGGALTWIVPVWAQVTPLTETMRFQE